MKTIPLILVTDRREVGCCPEMARSQQANPGPRVCETVREHRHNGALVGPPKGSSAVLIWYEDDEYPDSVNDVPWKFCPYCGKEITL